MKKIISFLLLSIFFFPVIVEAKVRNVDYKVLGMYVDSEIKENGSLYVKELIVLQGDFNGYERELNVANDKLTSDEINFEHSAIYNPSEITLYKVAAKKLNKTAGYSSIYEEYKEYKQVQKNDIGNTGTFQYYTSGTTQKIIRTYHSCSNCTVGFYYEYEVENAVVLHKDVAELYYQFIGESFPDKIKEVEIHVSLPDEDSSDFFRVWAHGNLTGAIEKDGTSGMIATIKNLKPYDPVDIRTTFDKKLITNTTTLDYTNVDAFDEILKVEKKRAEIANRERKIAKILYYGFQIVSGIYLVIMFLYFLFIVFRYDKEYKSDFDLQYNREFIEDYDVEVLDYLLHKSITSNAMSASIMNLIYKKKIEATQMDKKNYQFVLKDDTDLSASEKKLVDFLFHQVGQDNSFTIKQLKSYAGSSKTYSKFTSSYQAWKNMVLAQGKMQGFFEEHYIVRILAVLFAIIGVGISFFSIILIEGFVLSHFTFLFSIAFIFYVCCFRKKTIKGNNHYRRWKAFERFLKDFGTFDTKELPEVVLWERYLVYAVIFGLADQIENVMNVKIEELGLPSTEYETFHQHIFIHTNLRVAVDLGIRKAISSATAQSVSSSSSGRGGGFSSGGGFGGGGGGGHGF